MYKKQLLDEVYCDMKIINVEVRVIRQPSRRQGDNSYRDIHNLAYHKNRIQYRFIVHFKWKKRKTKSNNCFIIDFKPKITNMARKTIKNKPRRLNISASKIIELSVVCVIVALTCM